MAIEIKRIDHDFSICKVTEISENIFTQEYCFVGKTDEELSLVCLTSKVPENTIKQDDGWKAFRIQGILDFSLIGILAPITSILAKNKIGIFVVSTYNTDYFLVKKENFEKAANLLASNGYSII